MEPTAGRRARLLIKFDDAFAEINNASQKFRDVFYHIPAIFLKQKGRDYSRP
jgi:hypothetical protein